MVDNVFWGCNCPLLALAACHQRGMGCSRLVLFSTLFCVQAWWCLRAFRMVAIPQSGLLAQVSSLRLPSGHSGQILTLSNATPCLPAQPPLASGGCRHLRCFSIGGVTVGLVICCFYLFIFPPCYVALCASKARHRLGRESISWCLKLLSF